MNTNNILKSGLAAALSISMIASSSAPVLAASDMENGKDNQTRASLSVSDRTGLEEARLSYENADKALSKAKKERDAAEKVLNDKKEALAAATERCTRAREEYARANDSVNTGFIKTLEDARVNYETEQNRFSNAEASLDAAKQSKDKADSEYNDALTVRESAKMKYDNAVAERKTKALSFSEAKAAEESAETAYNKAREAYEKADAEYRSQQNKIELRNGLVVILKNYEKTLAERKTELDLKEAALKEAKKNRDASEEIYLSAQNDYDEVNGRFRKAVEVENNAKTELDDARERYAREREEANKALEEVKAPYNALGKKFLCEKLTGGISFDKLYQNTLNSEVVNRNTHIFDTAQGVKAFESSLEHLLYTENLLRSAEHFKTSNNCRRQEGLPELKIDYNYMMFSAFCNAVSMQTQDHILYSEAWNFGVIPDRASCSENLAWAAGDPYDVWYTDEKEFMEEEYAKKAQDPNYQIKYHFGHYLTLTNKKYAFSGVSTDGHNSEQFFSDKSSGITATPDEFISELNNYTSELLPAVQKAEQRVVTLRYKPDYCLNAEKEYAEAQKTVQIIRTEDSDALAVRTSALSEFKRMDKEYQKKSIAYNNEEAKYKAALENVNETKKEVEQFDSENPGLSSSSNLDSKRAKAKALMEEKHDACLKAIDNKAKAEEALNKAKDSESTLLRDVEIAESECTSKLTAKNKSSDEFKAAQVEVNNAIKSFTAAKDVYEQAQKIDRNNPSTYEKGFPSLKELITALTAAQENLEESEKTLKSAKQESREAEAVYETTTKVYENALKDFTRAKEAFDNYDILDITRVDGISVSGITNKTYSGNGISHKISVTYNGLPIDFKVEYPDGKTSVGTHAVIITGIGKYIGSLEYSFTILPKPVGARYYKKTKSSIKVSYKKIANTSGYQIAYRKKGSSKWKYVTTSASAKTISSLNRKTSYYIKVRTYKTVGKTTYFSTWSTTAKVTTK